MSQVKAIVDKLLTKTSAGLFQEAKLFVGSRILTPAKSIQSTGKIGKYSKDHLRVVATFTGGEGPSRRLKAIRRSSDTFSIEAQGLHDIVTKEDFANVEKPFMAREDTTIALTLAHLLAREFAIASVLQDPAVMTQGQTLVGAAQFSDYDSATSIPVEVIRDARIAVRNGCGFSPNKAIADWAVWEFLRYHPQILDNLGFKDNRPDGLTDQELARFFKVEEIIMAQALFNDAVEGQADDLKPVWKKDIILLHSPNSQKLRHPTVGYEVTFSNRSARQVFRESLFDPSGAEKILVEDNYDHLITDPNCAFLIQDAIA